ncbi:MAG TPA: hypothetical protein VKY74_07115 [Chloroflexia bacterium]|nr:hypothetical protein [Chloroflexia bacterium]
MNQPTEAISKQPGAQATLSTTGPHEQENVRLLETIFAAARAEAVYGTPVVAGPYTVITASEVRAGGGFGFGRGFGSAAPAAGAPTPAGAPAAGGGGGGGGGGGASGRPVALIVIGPAGVKVAPVVDVTGLALAGIGLGVRLIGLAGKLGGRRKTRGRESGVGGQG